MFLAFRLLPLPRTRLVLMRVSGNPSLRILNAFVERWSPRKPPKASMYYGTYPPLPEMSVSYFPSLLSFNRLLHQRSIPERCRFRLGVSFDWCRGRGYGKKNTHRSSCYEWPGSKDCQFLWRWAHKLGPTEIESASSLVEVCVCVCVDEVSSGPCHVDLHLSLRGGCRGPTAGALRTVGS